MVAEVLAHAGQMADCGDAHSFQLRGVTYAGEHEKMGRADSARADDNLARLDLKSLTAALDLHTNGASAIR